MPPTSVNARRWIEPKGTTVVRDPQTNRMTMNKLLMVLAFAAATVGALAQDKNKTPQERAHAQTERMTKDLGLSAEQATKLEAMNLKYAEQIDALRAEQQAQREAMRKEGKGKAMREAREAELKALLTPEQYTQWEVQREKMKELYKEKRKAERGEMREQQKQ